MTDPVHTGGCLCGAIGYAARGAPSDLIQCHCRFCQRATGSGFLVEAVFAKDAVSVTRGRPAVFDLPGGSGKMIHVQFCPTCGTKLFMTFDRFPEIAGLFTGTLDTPNEMLAVAPEPIHFFLSEALDGALFPAGEEVFDGHFWLSETRTDAGTRYTGHFRATEAVRRAAADRLAAKKARL